MNVALSLAAVAAGVALTLMGERLERPWLEWLGKPLASGAFVVLALLGWPVVATPWSYAILTALLLSAVGDVCLIAKGKGPGFLAGLVAFLLGHVAYVVAFVTQPLVLERALITAVLLAPAALWIARALVRRADARMAVAVSAYVAVISVMVTLAFAVPRGPVLPFAAVLFFVSDLFVARQRFVERAFVNRAVGLPIYYAAQVLFALNVA